MRSAQHGCRIDMNEDQETNQMETAPLGGAAALHLRLSQAIGECLFSHGWLLDREELFERSLARLRFHADLGDDVDPLEEVVVETARRMVQDARAAEALSAGRERFLRELIEGLGLTTGEARGAQERFHRLPIEDRQALLLLLNAQGNPGGRIYPGARRALLAIFDLKNLRAGNRS